VNLRGVSMHSAIIMVSHERLIVTYSAQDRTVCVLAPPGEDPRATLRVARLVLHDDLYEELANYMGVAPSWPVGREVAE
jgi:hypothetical protein